MARFRSHFKKKWHQNWENGETGRCVYEHMKKPNETDIWFDMPRRLATNIFRARCNHIHLLGSLVRKNENISPECRYCLARLETVDHALRRCPALSAKRKRLLPKCEHDVVWTQNVQEAVKAASLLLDFITRKGPS